jgi:hypothetical protein
MPETTAKKRPKKPPTAQGTTLTLPPKKKTGRPSKYTPEIAEEICKRLGTGEPLLQICRDDMMPERRTVYDWLERDPDLSAQFTRAREAGCDALAEEALVISNTPHLGQKQVMSDDGATTTIEDMLGHRKLQIETRLKLLACWNPSKYGTKVQLGGDPKNPLKVEASVQADSLLEALIKNAELKRQANE